MRALFLTHYYPPEAGAPQTRIAALAGGLQAAGHAVTVHTGFPHYPDGRVLAPYRNRPLLVERDGSGVTVVRSLVLPVANRGILPRLADHSTLAASALATARFSGAQDVVVVESPPLFTGAAAVPYARIKRAPLVFHASDLWPASAVQLGVLRNVAAVAAARRLERWCYRSASAVTVPTEGMLRALSATPEAGAKVRRMPPFVDCSRFVAAPPAPRDGPLRVLYAGTVGLAQGIETLLKAAALAGSEVVEVTVAGSGADAAMARALVRRDEIRNVRLLGVVPAGEVAALYRDCEAGVVLLRDRPIFSDALPTKLYECMAAGRAVIASAHGEAAALVQSLGAGQVVRPEDPHALAGAFRRLCARRSELAELGARGRAYVEREASLPVAVARWSRLLESLAAPHSALRKA